MYKKVIIMTILTCALLCISCSKTEKKEGGIFFEPDTQFLIGFKTNCTQTKARLFLDQKNSLHILHEDTSSPLFGLEEIFSKESIKSYFHEFEFENSPYSGGSATIYRALLTIKNEKNIFEETKEGITTYGYKTKEMSFSFSFEKKTRKPIRIFGKNEDGEFDINFSLYA